jgi:hypothetical protein
MQNVIIKDIVRGRFNWEFMLLTQNMKVLGSLANLATFMYPNTYEFNLETKKFRRLILKHGR